MDIVLDTCLLVRNDKNQSKVPGVDYTFLEKLLNDKNNNIFISPFSLPEIYLLRNYDDLDDLFADIASENVNILSYKYSHLQVNFNEFDMINRYSAIMFFHLTSFLEFFVFEVIHQFKLDDLDLIKRVIYETTEKFYKQNEPIALQNSTVFMKEIAIQYIVDSISSVFSHYGFSYCARDIWKIIGETKIGTFLSRDVCQQYIRYGRFLVCLFRNKYKNKAKKITLSFTFTDLLICDCTKNDFIVLSSDKEVARYLLTYGNDLNKTIISRLWSNDLNKFKFTS